MASREFPWRGGNIFGGEPEPPGAPPASGTVPGSLAPGGGVAISLPGFNYPPAGSIAVEAVAAAIVTPGLAASFVELVAFDIAIAEQFRIAEIGFISVDPTVLVFSEYRILKNGVPIPGYDSVPVPIGTIDHPGTVSLQVAGAARVSIEVRCLLPGVNTTHSLIGRVRGWRFNDPSTR